MAETISHDLDIYGREYSDGRPVIHYEKDALKNALTLFLTSNKGDFVMNPDEGGFLKELTFKQMSPEKLGAIYFKIKNAINKNFVPAIELINLSVTPEYRNKILKIDISYRDPLTFEKEALSIYTKDKSQEYNYDFIIVDYIEENLRNWAMIKKDSMGNQKLTYNTTESAWVWGQFKLSNLTTSDPYFSEILQICNLGV